MCTGSLPGPAEEAWLSEDGDAGEPLLLDAEPALHWRVAIPGLQRPVIGGHRGEVPGGDAGCGVCRVKGCASSMRQRMAELCLLGHCAKLPHGGGPQVHVDLTAGDDELGVAGARQRVLQDGVLGLCPVRLVQNGFAVVKGAPGKPERVFGRPSQSHCRGIWLTALAASAQTPVIRSWSACLRRWRMTSASTVWTHGL